MIDNGRPSCDLRPQMNRSVLMFCTPRLGIARVQKLAVLQSFDDKQMIATCEALVAGDWQGLLLDMGVSINWGTPK